MKRTLPHVEPEGPARPGRRRAPRPSPATFALVALALLVAYLYPYPEHSLPQRATAAYLATYARLAGALVRLFDASVHVDGTVIAGRFSLRIVRSCDAAEAMLLFLAAVVAYPAAAWKRLAGAAAGGVLLLACNLVRITSLYFVGLARPDVFELVHLQVWPYAVLGVAAACFLAWTRWARPPGSYA